MPACPPSTFCDRCNAVLFDDSKMGGFAAGRDDAQEILKLGEGNDAMQVLPVDFILIEPYPGLPSLSKSAKAGCAFCEFLKTTVVRNAINVALENGFDVSTLDSIKITLKYIWQANVRETPGAKGLRALEIDFCLLDNEGL